MSKQSLRPTKTKSYIKRRSVHDASLCGSLVKSCEKRQISRRYKLHISFPVLIPLLQTWTAKGNLPPSRIHGFTFSSRKRAQPLKLLALLLAAVSATFPMHYIKQRFLYAWKLYSCHVKSLFYSHVNVYLSDWKTGKGGKGKCKEKSWVVFLLGAFVRMKGE